MGLSNNTFIGIGNDGSKIFVGMKVDHAEKGFKNGVVSGDLSEYKGEIAVKVDFPTVFGTWTARVSKLVPHVMTLADFNVKVGDTFTHKKYSGTYTITSEKIGEYKGEPCCYTNGGRETRFSQLGPKVEPKVETPAPAQKSENNVTNEITTEVCGGKLSFIENVDEGSFTIRLTKQNGEVKEIVLYA